MSRSTEGYEDYMVQWTGSQSFFVDLVKSVKSTVLTKLSDELYTSSLQPATIYNEIKNKGVTTDILPEKILDDSFIWFLDYSSRLHVN